MHQSALEGDAPLEEYFCYSPGSANLRKSRIMLGCIAYALWHSIDIFDKVLGCSQTSDVIIAGLSRTQEATTAIGTAGNIAEGVWVLLRYGIKQIKCDRFVHQGCDTTPDWGGHAGANHSAPLASMINGHVRSSDRGIVNLKISVVELSPLTSHFAGDFVENDP